jgi:hypothetical protein
MESVLKLSEKFIEVPAADCKKSVVREADSKDVAQFTELQEMLFCF